MTSKPWLLYGRSEYAEPLTARDTTVASEEDVADRARSALPGTWVELVAIPEEALCWIVQEGEEVEDGRAVRARG
jgi:hypothetical protein